MKYNYKNLAKISLGGSDGAFFWAETGVQRKPPLVQPGDHTLFLDNVQEQNLDHIGEKPEH